MQVSDEDFEKYLAEAIDAIPAPSSDHLQNVAFILEDEPTPSQREKLKLYPNETLYGLYEGVPLPQRGGTLKLLPDKITLFKNPLLAASRDVNDLRVRIGHTLWHEVAHYYGLDHRKIHELDHKKEKDQS
jgi:predicted Zn-dependent protease with MMP-like domain